VAAADGDPPAGGRRDRVETALLGALLAGPTVLAFASGGFFDRPRVVALIVAWIGVLVAALAARRPVPAGGPAVVAVAALAGLAVWTMVATAWAPLTGPAIDDAQRLLLYLAVLILACALARGERRRLVVPGLAAGALVVVAYALAGRLLPALVPQTQTATGFGRLEQPLTYWNALGLLAAFGTVLWVGIAADATRPRPLRALAPAAGVVLVLGASLTFSRGALAALGAGLVVLAVLAPTRAAVRAAAVVVVAGVAASAVAGLFDGVRAAEGAAGTRTVQGLVVLAVLAGLAGAAVAAGRWIRAADAGPAARPARPSGAGAVVRAGAAVLAGAAAVAVLVLVTGGAPRTATPETGADARRLASLSTNRYEYWQVAAGGFAAAPLRGEGPASFRVRWLREREVGERVVDAHSLPVETATELGLVGLVLLLALAGAVVAGARRARDPVAARRAGRVRAARVPGLGLGDARGDPPGARARRDGARRRGARCAPPRPRRRRPRSPRRPRGRGARHDAVRAARGRPPGRRRGGTRPSRRRARRARARAPPARGRRRAGAPTPRCAWPSCTSSPGARPAPSRSSRTSCAASPRTRRHGVTCGSPCAPSATRGRTPSRRASAH
jgi:hypothetical protein